LSEDAISSETKVVILVLVTEAQCEQVCFGSQNDSTNSTNLLKLLPADSYVILCSTVTATWAKRAELRFREEASVRFVDCPISGGPVRARAGDLTLMASVDYVHDAVVLPILTAMAREVHTIPGGVGMGSTAKMVHQLLAGVHVCAAAEALALAAKAGLNPHQMYEIVNGAAGASWMFQDRGARMMLEEEPPVMSALKYS
jgi:putative dehydrogenase